MTSDTINLGEILFGEKFTTAVDKAKAEIKAFSKVHFAQVEAELEAKFKAKLEAKLKAEFKTKFNAKVEIERIKTEKQQIFLQLKNVLNLVKRLPALPNEDYAQILEGITPTLVKTTKLTLQDKKKATIKEQLAFLFFRHLPLSRKDQKKLSEILTDYFKEETDS